MSKVKNITVSVMVVLFTVLNLYNLERPVPTLNEGQLAYDTYAYSYLMFTGIGFCLCLFCYAVGVLNRFIKSLLFVNFGSYLILAIKSYFHVSYAHNYYDITGLGLFVITATYYFINPYKKDIARVIKAILNQIHNRLWQNKREKPG